MKTHAYYFEPVPKPRMTQRDKWKKRPVVERYRAFKDLCRDENVSIPESGAHIRFYLKMPKSWSKKKKLAMEGHPHQQRPDIDNLLKGLLDAVYHEDSVVYNISASKYWSVNPGFTISVQKTN